MKSGDTFLTPDHDDHLWMVISDPSMDPIRLVVVCFLSWQGHYDQACVVEVGDHPFVKHATCVNYPGAQLVQDSVLEKLRSQGRLKVREPLSSALLEKIRGAAENSDIPTESYDVLREQGYVG